MTDDTMQARIDLAEETPDVWGSLIRLDRQAARVGLDAALLHLIKLRASQINGCSFCIDLHAREAREGGETEQRLYGLDAWREAPFYSHRERAALDLTEAVTLVAQTRVPGDVWERAAEAFDRREIAALLWSITTINAFNRVAIASRMVPAER